MSGNLGCVFRAKTLAVITACTLGLTAVTACEDSAPDTPVDQPVGVKVDPPRVELKDAGHGEKKVLAFTDIGQKQDVTATVKEGFSQDVMRDDAVGGFTPHDIDTRTTTLPLSGSTDEATDDADQKPATRNVFFTASHPTAEGDDAADLSSADGFQLGWRGADDGSISSLRLAAPTDADDGARAAAERALTKLTSMPVVFPEEEIGKGATWTVETRVAGEATMLQTTTYTLQDVGDDDTVTLGVDVSQRPSLGALSFGAEAQGTDLEGKELAVKNTTSSSKGTLTVDLHQPLPTKGSVDVDTQVVYGTDDSPLRVVQSSVTGVEFAPQQETK